MGATIPFNCPIKDCEFTTYFHLGMGEEASSEAYSERVDVLRQEHPNHPASPPHRERLLV